MTSTSRLIPVLLAFLAGCSSERDPQTGRTEGLPDVQAQRRTFERPPFEISLDGHGLIRVGAAPDPVSLDALAERLRTAVQQEEAERGLDRHSGGVETSRMDFLLRVHGDAPHKHLRYLATVLAECRARRTWLATANGGAVRYWLPFDKPLSLLGEEAPPTYRIEVRGIGEATREYGDASKTVKVPAGIGVRVGRSRKEIATADVFGWFAARVRQKGRIRVALKASWTVRVGDLMPILAALDQEGIELDLPLDTIPSKEMRQLDRLPHPPRPYASAGR